MSRLLISACFMTAICAGCGSPDPEADASPVDIFVTDSPWDDSSLADIQQADSTSAPTCKDGVQNQDETDVDCGGSCGPCADGKKCKNHGDCISKSDGLFCNGPEGCVSGICAAKGTAPACKDGISCTTDSCDETEKRCQYKPQNSSCKKGEVCVPFKGCKLDIGRFGWLYENLIPSSADKSIYKDYRIAVLTGLVKDDSGKPISGVKVTVHGETKYGSVLTNAKGRFSIPVNGGGHVKIVYFKTGYLKVHRQKRVPWKGIKIVDTVELTSLESQVTSLILDGKPTTVTVHKNSAIKRPASLVVSGDNKVYSVGSKGKKTLLASAKVRITEYLTPGSMPEILPPTTAFTYCADFTVDGAENVSFEKPIVVYIKNSLGFAVGDTAPVGYYDRIKASWIPSINGLVVRLLDTNSDGKCDSLDATGNGVKDDLNNNGKYSDEVVGLSNNTVYKPGDTYWRVETEHFSPIDVNWRWNTPPDAVQPNMPPPVVSTISQEPCYTKGYSEIECRSQSLSEKISIPGATFSLHYNSNRVAGYETPISIQTSGSTIPSSLKKILARLTVAGNVIEKELLPGINKNVQLSWNGKDVYGNPVYGQPIATLEVGYQYDAIYYTAGNGLQVTYNAFGLPGGTSTKIVTRQATTLWQRFSQPIVSPFVKNQVANGWTLGPYHSYDPISKSVALGNGRIIYGNTTHMVSTILKKHFRDLTVSPDGEIYLAGGGGGAGGSYPHQILKLSKAGVLTPIAGTGSQGYSGDGGLALNAKLNDPCGVALSPDGTVYFTEIGNHVVRKITPDGKIQTVAGNGSNGNSGDGKSATNAKLGQPYDVLVSPLDGSIFIADLAYNRVRRVAPDGNIATYAGGGSTLGDNGPATKALVQGPLSLAADSTGALYIGCFMCYRVRKVTPNGIITTVAGIGQPGNSGDGGLAIKANLNQRISVAFSPDGMLYISDNDNHRVRVVTSDGKIATFAGNGSLGDGSPAYNASLFKPTDIAFSPDGNLYISSHFGGFLRQINKLNYGVTTAANEIVFPQNEKVGHVFDMHSGHHKKTIDLKTATNLYVFGHDSNGSLINISDRFGNTTYIVRDLKGKAASIISPYGNVTKINIESNNDLSSVAYPDGTGYTFKYNSGSLIKEKTDPNGGIYKYTYDTSGYGRITRAEDPAGGFATFSRTVATDGTVTSKTTTADGKVTSYLDQEDSLGNKTSKITDPLNGISNYKMSSDGLTETKTYPDGTTTTVSWDVDKKYRIKYRKAMTIQTPGKVTYSRSKERTYNDTAKTFTDKININGQIITSTTDITKGTVTTKTPEGRTILEQYSPTTLLLMSRIVTGGSNVSWTYDKRGRVKTHTEGTETLTYTYDGAGNLESVKDAAGNTNTYGYNSMARPTSHKLPDKTNFVIGYGKNGYLTGLTYPTKAVHTFGRNSVNLMSSWKLPTGKSFIYDYNKDRERKLVTLPSKKTIKTTMVSGLPKAITTPDGVTSYDYMADKSGRIDTVTSSDGQKIKYGYDGHLVTSTTYSGIAVGTVKTEYNSNFQPKKITVGSNEISMTYDKDGLLDGVKDVKITPNTSGSIKTIGDGKMTLSIARDSLHRPSGRTYKLGTSTIYTVSWKRYPKTGLISSKTETIGGKTKTWGYTYNSRGSLEEVQLDGKIVEKYGYDSMGNRTSMTNTFRSLSGENATYDNLERLKTRGLSTYDYDDDGYLTSENVGGKTTMYKYSTLGSLKQVTLGSSKKIEYQHDGHGRVVARKVDGKVTSKFLYLDFLRPIAELDASSKIKRLFIYARERVPFYMLEGGTKYYLLKDQVGSVRLVIKEDGTVVQQFDYDTFGYLTATKSSTFDIPFGFAGGFSDRATGHVKFGLRQYEVATGRWTSLDPIAQAGGYNLYGYAHNDPVNFIDRDGTFAVTATIVVVIIGASTLYGTYQAFKRLSDAADKAGEKLRLANASACNADGLEQAMRYYGEYRQTFRKDVLPAAAEAARRTSTFPGTSTGGLPDLFPDHPAEKAIYIGSELMRRLTQRKR